MPLGTRGGAVVRYTFPQDGEYEIQIRLMRDRNEQVEGLNEPHELEVLLDRERVELFTVKPPPGRGRRRLNHADVDKHLKRPRSGDGRPARVGVTFLKKPSALLETARQPYQAHFNMYRHPRLGPAVYSGFRSSARSTPKAPGETPSRRRIFV